VSRRLGNPQSGARRDKLASTNGERPARRGGGHAGCGQLQALLSRTFNVGIEVDRREPLALNRLELAKALQGAVEANTLAAKGIAIERGVGTEEIAASEALALHAAACNGMPDPVFQLLERTIGVLCGLSQIQPDPRAAPDDMLLAMARQAASGLAQILQARHGITTAETPAQRDAVTAALINAGEQLGAAAEAVTSFFALAEQSWAAGRHGHEDLN